MLEFFFSFFFVELEFIFAGKPKMFSFSATLRSRLSVSSKAKIFGRYASSGTVSDLRLGLAKKNHL